MAERDRERAHRPCPRSWIRRLLLTAGVTVSAWLLLGGSPADAAPGVSGVSPSTALTAIDAAEVAGTANPAGVGIAAPAVAQAADRRADGVVNRSTDRAAMDSVVTPAVTPAVTPIVSPAAEPAAGSVTGQALRRSRPHDTSIDTSAVSSDRHDPDRIGADRHDAGRMGAGWMGAGRTGQELDGAVLAVAFGDAVGERFGPERSGPMPGLAHGQLGPDVTPTLGAVVDTAHPVLDRVDEVFPAMPGEPGVVSPNDRETPGLSVEAPHTSTEPGMGWLARFLPRVLFGFGTESLAAAMDLAHLSGSPFSRGAITGGSGTGNDAGPALPDPAPPVPGPSPDSPDGTASTASGHGSVDRGQNVATDTSPLVVAPQLVPSFVAASRTTGHSERAVRPSVSPD